MTVVENILAAFARRWSVGTPDVVFWSVFLPAATILFIWERKSVRLFRDHPFRVGIVTFVLSLAILWWLPRWKIESRGALALMLGGLFTLVGLYFTWWTIEGAEEGRVTDRFTRAIEQLGSEKVDVRIGAIYALERIARDSERDHWPVMEVLSAFIREHSRWSAPKAPSETTEDGRPGDDLRPRSKLIKTGNEPVPEADVQAALTVIGRRRRTFEKGEMERLNLSQTDLRGAYLWQANLDGVALGHAHLEMANLRSAHLRGAFLGAANLGMALLECANLEGAILSNSRLGGALLQGSHLEGADLTLAYGLTPEQIRDAFWDLDTKWPPGFSPPERTPDRLTR